MSQLLRRGAETIGLFSSRFRNYRLRVAIDGGIHTPKGRTETHMKTLSLFNICCVTLLLSTSPALAAESICTEGGSFHFTVESGRTAVAIAGLFTAGDINRARIIEMSTGSVVCGVSDNNPTPDFKLLTWSGSSGSGRPFCALGPGDYKVELSYIDSAGVERVIGALMGGSSLDHRGQILQRGVNFLTNDEGNCTGGDLDFQDMWLQIQSFTPNVP